MILARLHMVKDVVNAESRKGKLLGACACMGVCLWTCFLLKERFGN